MPEGAFYQPKRTSPTALAIVVLMHGAAITALALSKMDVVPNVFKRTTVVDITEPPPPPEVPPEPVEARVQPKHVSSVDVVKPPFPVPTPPTDFEMIKLPPTPPQPIPVSRIDIPPTPPLPPPPPPRKLEPARAKANLASYVSDADYPASALRSEEQGATRFKLTVGTNGRVTECAILSSSGSSALDTATCRIMKSRARFTPARDSDGNPTGDSVTSTIRWVLPD